jgi:large subunit ribosomal protein L25
MKDIGVFKAERRVKTKSAESKRLRKAGIVPGNIFGKGIESESISIKSDEFRRVLLKHGRNAVYKIELPDGESYTVIVKDIQKDPLGRGYLNIGFQQISLAEEIKIDVPIRIKGQELVESKRLVVIRQIDTIPVRALPQNIPDAIEIDVSDLQAGDVVNIGSINLPEGVETDSDPEQVVISINEPKLQAADEAEVTEEDAAGSAEAAEDSAAEEKAE